MESSEKKERKELESEWQWQVKLIEDLQLQLSLGSLLHSPALMMMFMKKYAMREKGKDATQNPILNFLFHAFYVCILSIDHSAFPVPQLLAFAVDSTYPVLREYSHSLIRELRVDHPFRLQFVEWYHCASLANAIPSEFTQADEQLEAQSNDSVFWSHIVVLMKGLNSKNKEVEGEAVKESSVAELHSTKENLQRILISRLQAVPHSVMVQSEQQVSPLSPDVFTIIGNRCQVLHSRERVPFLLALDAVTLAAVSPRMNTSPAKNQTSPLGANVSSPPVVKEQTSLFEEATPVSTPPQKANSAPFEPLAFSTSPLRYFIIKSDDDLRQEFIAMQCLRWMDERFRMNPVDLFFEDVGSIEEEKVAKPKRRGFGRKPAKVEKEQAAPVKAVEGSLSLTTYEIHLKRGASTTSKEVNIEMGGIIEVLRDTSSLHDIRMASPDIEDSEVTEKYFTEVLQQIYKDPIKRSNFMATFTAASICSYVLKIKDRHNANILLSTGGHWINIDFGFWLERAPGGMFSVETAAFKLPDEVFKVFFQGSKDSNNFQLFCTNFVAGVHLILEHLDELYTLLSGIPPNVLAELPCCEGKSLEETWESLKERVSKSEKQLLNLANDAVSHLGTRHYDRYQFRTNRIR